MARFMLTCRVVVVSSGNRKRNSPNSASEGQNFAKMIDLINENRRLKAEVDSLRPVKILWGYVPADAQQCARRRKEIRGN